MATCSLFEEDVVCHVTPDNGFIYGLVMENSESVSSDEEDPRQDGCRRGCVRIAWHPKGRESFNTPENKVLLADRSLMVADAVRRFVPGQETQCGIVQDLQITCHLHVTGTDKYIYNVDSKLLSPCIQLQKFENGYVTMDNWLGRVEEVIETITLLLPDGARCELDDADAAYLDDISEKRPETVTFNEEYWYHGQQLKGELGSLCNATWLNSTLLYNTKNVENKRNSTFYAVVESVKIRCIYVYWICCGYSKASLWVASQSMPPLKIQGDDIDRLQLVDCFEHCSVKLGDKAYYTIREEDVVETQPPKNHFVPHAAQRLSSQQLAEVTHKTEDLYHQRFEESGRPRRRGSKRGVVSAASASSSNATATTVTSSVSGSSLLDSAMAVETDGSSMDMEKAKKREENVKNSFSASSQAAVEKGAGDLDADHDADDEHEDANDRKDDTDSDDGSLSSSASGAKRRKRDRGIGVSIKSLKRTSRQARRTRPVMEISVKAGSRVATELCYTFSQVTVLWQDGSVEKNIPSVELYPMHHLDELEYFPGTYVVNSSDSSTNNEYGVITSCNRFERTCQVKWFQPYEVGKGTFPTEVIKESEVSVYDIHDHPDYKFRPGNSVIRVSGFENTEQTLQAVGQVVRLDPSGTIFVRWSDGSYTSSYPQDLYIVWDMSDYSNSSSEAESNSSEYDSTGSNSNDSWETEEEEWKVDGDRSHSEDDAYNTAKEDDEKYIILKDMDEQWTSEIELLMTKITSCFEIISETYTSVSSNAPDAIHKIATAQPALIAGFKRLLKGYRAWHKLEKEMKCGECSCDTTLVTNLVASIKYDIKRAKSNKIKQHVAHVFESTNKGLLDQSREVKRSEVATDTSDLQVTHRSGTEQNAESSSLASCDTAVKNLEVEDAGTSVDAEVGSSVDASSNTAGSSGECGSPSRLQDVEKDISSRLAATNVDESEDTGKRDTQDDGASVAACPVTDAQGQASDNPAALGDGDRAMELLQTLHTNLAIILESLAEMEKLVESAGRKSEDRSSGKPAEEKEEKGKRESKVKSESHSSVLIEEEREADMEELAGTEVDVRADNLEACDSGSGADSKPSVMVNGTAGEEEDIEDPPGVLLPQGFFMSGAAPGCHSYAAKTCMPSNPKKFNASVRKELKLLGTSLPPGIIIKGFEDRMDLFSVLIDGPIDTPYEDGMFLFDVMLPHDYPTSPPLFHYLSYASDRLNPNLYVDGKVCVSLLGTWSGKGMEVWTDQSNLLQVLVSIQGLILVDEPYYNEAGYEKQRGHQIALENSRMYNEMALLRLVESMTAICHDPPKPFGTEVRERLKTNGPRMIARLRRWVSLSETWGDRHNVVTPADGEQGAEGGTFDDSERGSSVNDSAAANGSASAGESIQASNQAAETGETGGSKGSHSPGHPRFPLLPMSKGFRLTLQKSLVQFETALNKVKTCEQVEGSSEHGQASCEQLDSDPS